MEKIKCPHCNFDGYHKINLVFFEPDLVKLRAGADIVPKYSIKCVCGDCGKYIKFLNFKNNLEILNRKYIDY